MLRYKTSCVSCKLEIQNRFFNSHKCKTALSLECNFCGKLAKNLNSAAQHLIRCENNPNQIDLSQYKDGINFASYWKKVKNGEIEHLNGFLKAEKLGLPKPKFSEEASKKISEANRRRVWDDAARRKHSASMKKAVEDSPESYTSSNRGRTKQIIYKGKKFQGGWELKFYQWCEVTDIVCERNTEGFSYEWNGKRTYYPDFYLPKFDAYVEVKGYKTERDKAKWNQFKGKLIVIEKQSIKEIEVGSFQLKL
jgi:hypothetical protein